MKRVAILIGLAAGAVAVVVLLMSMSGDDVKRERRAGGVDGDRPAIGEGSGEPGAEIDPTSGDGAAVGADNDPNRIPGPDVTVKGVVLYDGKPVAGAKVQLIRAWPANPDLAPHWLDPRRTSAAPAPIAETEADENGRFTLAGSRRSRVAVRAWGENTSVATASLLVPAKGDPNEVTLRVGPAFEITGIVVDEEGKPVAGAKLTSSSSSWQNYPFLQHAESGADGRFGFAQLGRGSHTLVVEKEGYPTLHRSFQVPETRS